MADLLFGDPPLGHSADLVFGEDTVADGTLVLASVTGAFAALSFAALVGTVLDVSATGSFAPWTFDATVSYVSNTQRPTVRQVSSIFQQATHCEAGLLSSMQQAKPLPASVRSAWQATTGLQVGNSAVWQDAKRTPKPTTVVFEDATPVSTGLSACWQDARRTHKAARSTFDEATRAVSGTRFAWQEARRLRLPVSAMFENAFGLRTGLIESGDYATPLHAHRSVRFQDARRPPAGIRTVVVPPNPDACYTPSPNLLFDNEWSAADKNLVFFCKNHSGGGVMDHPRMWLCRYGGSTL